MASAIGESTSKKQPTFRLYSQSDKYTICCFTFVEEKAKADELVRSENTVLIALPSIVSPV